MSAWSGGAWARFSAAPIIAIGEFAAVVAGLIIILKVGKERKVLEEKTEPWGCYSTWMLRSLVLDT